MSFLRIQFAAVFLLTAGFAAGQGYHVTGSIPIGGSGGWDYLTADGAANRLYVSHGSEVVVIDTRSQKVVGKVEGVRGVHGIAIAPDLGTGYISAGASNEVVSFALSSLDVKARIPAGTNPDGIVYDPVSKRVFAFNGRSQNATVVDAASGKVAATIPLGGKPEFPVSDGAGSVYDNIEDKSEIVRIDVKSLKVSARWSVAPCDSPSGLAFDSAGRRLFAVCDNNLMAVVNADTGKVIATPRIGSGPDAAAYDPQTRLAFSSNGEGTVTVVKAEGNKYEVAQTVPTTKGARTMTLDPNTHTLYLAAAELGPAPAATASNPHPRPAIVPDTFKVLIVQK